MEMYVKNELKLDNYVKNIYILSGKVPILFIP